MSDHLDPLRRTFRRIGLGLTIVGASLTGLFGLTMSSHYILAALIAGGLVCAAVASAYVWPFVSAAVRAREYGSAAALCAFGLLCTTVDLTTNFGSIAHLRGSNASEAKVQTTKYDDVRKSVADLEFKKAALEDNLKKLEGSKGWTSTKPANAWLGEMETLKLAVEAEAKRVRCADKCIALRKQLAELEANHAVAVAHEQDAKRLAATIEALAKMRDKSGTIERHDAATVNQTITLASMITLSRNPSEDAQHWTDKGVMWLVAGFFALGAIGCNWIGWGSVTHGPAPTVTAQTIRPRPSVLPPNPGQPKTMIAANDIKAAKDRVIAVPSFDEILRAMKTA